MSSLTLLPLAPAIRKVSIAWQVPKEVLANILNFGSEAKGEKLILETRYAELMSSPEVENALVSLNNTHALELSYLDVAGLRRLVYDSSVSWRIGVADALLIAFDQDAPYVNQNFAWFKKRYATFLYVDRVVVAPAARGKGFGRSLYENVFHYASRNGHERVVCEVNMDPPNPTSDAFHHSMGFVEVGTATLSGTKTVRYFERRLSLVRLSPRNTSTDQSKKNALLSI
jgi:hypothetical protein